MLSSTTNANVFELLKWVNQRPEPYEYYTADVLWTDEHISSQMLKFHLNESIDPASRKKTFIDRSVDWICSEFGVDSDTRIIDFGCGPGLYTTQLAQRGAQVTGLDFSERSLNYARNTAKLEGLEIDYILGNYLDFKADRSFDLITLIYCDFCPLSPQQRKQLLSIFHSILNKDGFLLLDVFSLNMFEEIEETATYERFLLDGFWSKEDYFGFMNTFKYPAEKVGLDKYTIVEKNRIWQVYNWLQYYDRQSLILEFQENGFKVTGCFADVAGTPFDPASREIAIVAQKA